MWEIGALQAWPKVLIDELAQNFSKSEIGATLGDFRPKTAVIKKHSCLVADGKKLNCMALLLARLTIDNALQGPVCRALQGSAKTVMKKTKIN